MGGTVVKPTAPGASRYARVPVSKPQATAASWEEADADLLWRAITAVTNAQDAIMLSRTRDGGAVVLTILSESERVKSYATGEEEIRTLLTSVLEAARDV